MISPRFSFMGKDQVGKGECGGSLLLILQDRAEEQVPVEFQIQASCALKEAKDWDLL